MDNLPNDEINIVIRWEDDLFSVGKVRDIVSKEIQPKNPLELINECTCILYKDQEYNR